MASQSIVVEGMPSNKSCTTSLNFLSTSIRSASVIWLYPDSGSSTAPMDLTIQVHFFIDNRQLPDHPIKLLISGRNFSQTRNPDCSAYLSRLQQYVDVEIAPSQKVRRSLHRASYFGRKTKLRTYNYFFSLLCSSVWVWSWRCSLLID